VYLSNQKRVIKVCLNLLQRPKIIPKYLLYFFHQNSPLDAQLPWWSYDAISHIQKSHFISSFEWGSGGSSLFLSKISKNLTTVENDIQWFNKLGKKITEEGIVNINLLKKSIDLSNPENFQKSEYLHALNKKHDLIAIDGEDHFGAESSWSARVYCFKRAQYWIKDGGIIIVDDSWRYPEIIELSNAKSVLSFESVEPSRIGVTSTDIHLY
jgi:hypothetical protein